MKSEPEEASQKMIKKNKKIKINKKTIGREEHMLLQKCPYNPRGAAKLKKLSKSKKSHREIESPAGAQLIPQMTVVAELSFSNQRQQVSIETASLYFGCPSSLLKLFLMNNPSFKF